MEPIKNPVKFAKVYLECISVATHTNLLNWQARPSFAPSSMQTLFSDWAEPVVLKSTIILLDKNHVTMNVQECS